MYYADKLPALREIFGVRDLDVRADRIRLGTAEFPITNDVIDLMPTQRGGAGIAEDIQFTFGAEWREHGRILPEHAAEFAQYFDIVDIGSLKDARVFDLGCGSGRWSFFLKYLHAHRAARFSRADRRAPPRLRRSPHRRLTALLAFPARSLSVSRILSARR